MTRAGHVAHMAVPLHRLNDDVIQVEFVMNNGKLVQTLRWHQFSLTNYSTNAPYSVIIRGR